MKDDVLQGMGILKKKELGVLKLGVGPATVR